MGIKNSSNIDFFTDLSGRFVHSFPKFWQWMGAMEYEYLEENCTAFKDISPVYVGGMARSGSTILLQKLYDTDAFISHRYCDYPFINIPYIWDKWISLFLKDTNAIERSHKDGLKVTPKSPEAMEEMLWMQFFPDLHPKDGHSILDQHVSHKGFEKFYLHHIQKMMLRGQGRQYLAKGNYNSQRIGYISKIIPHAKFLVPIRDPISHIASLIKQHRLFSEDHTQHPRNRRYMDIVGHYEFGTGRLPLAAENVGDVEFYAREWASTYNHIHSLLNDDATKSRIIITRYEDLCDNPKKELDKVTRFLKLDDIDTTSLSQDIRAPSYYQPDFSDEDLAIIQEHTNSVKAYFY